MRTIHSIGIAAFAAVALAACGGSDKAATATTTTPTATVSSTTLVTTTASNATTAKSTTTKVNANTATQAELQAAFQAAGVSNPAQWAREVTEYRPYTADDTNWGKLRKELAKYNIAADVLEKIIATLTI